MSVQEVFCGLWPGLICSSGHLFACPGSALELLNIARWALQPWKEHGTPYLQIHMYLMHTARRVDEAELPCDNSLRLSVVSLHLARLGMAPCSVHWVPVICFLLPLLRAAFSMASRFCSSFPVLWAVLPDFKQTFSLQRPSLPSLSPLES